MHMRPLQHWLHIRVPRWAWHRGTYRVNITLLCREIFRPWEDISFLWSGVPLEQVSRHIIVTTDASKTGWGAVCNGRAASGVWTGPRLLWHINCLELLTVLLALKRFQPLIQGKHVLVHTDNTATVAYINHQGSVCSFHNWLQAISIMWPILYHDRFRFGVSGGSTLRWSSRFGVDLARHKIHSLPVLVRSNRGPPHYRCSGTQLAKGLRQNLVLGPCAPIIDPSLVHSSEEGPPFSGEWHNLAPAPRSLEPPPMRIFVNWCSSQGKDPQRCLDRHLSASTLKVHVAAISANQDLVEGRSVGKHDLIMRVLRGAQRLNPPRPNLIPSWDLTVVLQALQQDPFEPLQVGDFQALSVNSLCLEFGPADSHVVLRPRPGYAPKVPTTPFRDKVVTLQAISSQEGDPNLNLLCPFRALRIYLECTQPFRCSEQLFVCFRGQQKGKAVSKQTISHWLVDTTPSVVIQHTVSIPSIRERGLPYITKMFFSGFIFCNDQNSERVFASPLGSRSLQIDPHLYNRLLLCLVLTYLFATVRPCLYLTVSLVNKAMHLDLTASRLPRSVTIV
ncbi:ORF V: Enzymatic polyprotein [Labeo rohita]|uniref:ORF V: Enzymatic polyprotein n=1 Tax=Labeo rohita TaxID=84645 RepID=A0ABQ8L246_LABRO|nr:ORF V: Enzymatic polyprotein [Labeo rohita]